jgi:hypothetical protein
MQLYLTPNALLFFLTFTPFVSSSTLLYIKQETLNLLNSLYAFNLDPINDYTINIQCDTGSMLVSSEITLDKYITNLFRKLDISILPLLNLFNKIKILIFI